MEYKYEEISWMERRTGDVEYRFGNAGSFSLLILLNDIGRDGWELVGEIQGKIIIKKLVRD